MSSVSRENEDRQRSIWSAHIAQVLQELKLPATPKSGHLTEAVALYCRHYHPAGVHSSDLALLIARCFCSIDERAAAEQVLSRMEPHARHVERWLEILSELHTFPELLPCFSVGAIRPADWAGAQVDRMWVLDFSRVILTDFEKHEIVLHHSIRALTEAMSAFWDATSGEGVLGLRHLDVLELPPAVRDLKGSESWQDFIQAVLSLSATERGWNKVPSMLNLDL